MVNKITVKGLKKNIGKQVLVWSDGSVKEGTLKSSSGFFYVKLRDEGSWILQGRDRLGIQYESGSFRLYDLEF
jgi:hypothetical protein